MGSDGLLIQNDLKIFKRGFGRWVVGGGRKEVGGGRKEWKVGRGRLLIHNHKKALKEGMGTSGAM